MLGNPHIGGHNFMALERREAGWFSCYSKPQVYHKTVKQDSRFKLIFLQDTITLVCCESVSETQASLTDVCLTFASSDGRLM